MNRTTTVVVALIAAAGLSTMVYAVPEQRALAWFGGGFGGGCGFGWGGCGGFGGCGFGCGGPFFVHKTIIQTIHQVNNCTGGEEQKAPLGNDQKDGEDHNQNANKVVCLNTAANTARSGFGGGFGPG
jgi:hypothetical protein